ncbi:MAG: hypothetical protein ACYC9L_16845 [Sulfuricaulis sp.]
MDVVDNPIYCGVKKIARSLYLSSRSLPAWKFLQKYHFAAGEVDESTKCDIKVAIVGVLCHLRLLDSNTRFTIMKTVDYPYGFDCRARGLFGGPCIFQG